MYLERFFGNALLGEDNNLQSRYLIIGAEKVPSSLVPPQREQAREQVKEQVASLIPARVKKLLKVLDGEKSVVEMMIALKLGGRRNFLEKYLVPAMELGLIEMPQPDSPRSPTQKYRLTDKRQSSSQG